MAAFEQVPPINILNFSIGCYIKEYKSVREPIEPKKAIEAYPSTLNKCKFFVDKPIN